METTEENEPTVRKLADMRVVDLRQELEKRGLDKGGVKASLVERLAKGVGHYDPQVSYMPDHRFRMLTCALVTATIGTAIMVPNIEFVLGLVGSTIGITICVILPALIFLHLTSKNTNERRMAEEENADSKGKDSKIMENPDKDLEIQMQLMKNNHEKQLLKKDQQLKENDYIIGLLIKDKDHWSELQDSQIQSLKNEHNLELEKVLFALAQSNMRFLTSKKEITPKHIIDLVEASTEFPIISVRSINWKTWAEKQPLEILQMDFKDPNLIAETVTNLYKKKTAFAHELHSHGMKLFISHDALEHTEWKLMKVLWKAVPLPINTLVKITKDGTEEIVA